MLTVKLWVLAKCCLPCVFSLHLYCPAMNKMVVEINAYKLLLWVWKIFLVSRKSECDCVFYFNANIHYKYMHDRYPLSHLRNLIINVQTWVVRRNTNAACQQYDSCPDHKYNASQTILAKKHANVLHANVQRVTTEMTVNSQLHHATIMSMVPWDRAYIRLWIMTRQCLKYIVILIQMVILIQTEKNRFFFFWLVILHDTVI